MKTAVVTGASSGIGQSVAEKLLDMGFFVYGLARDFSKSAIRHDSFVSVSCDLTDTARLVESIQHIRQQSRDIHVLVNNAGIGFFGPHEQLRPEQIAQMVATNLTAPLIVTQLLLRDIKRTHGTIINISSVTAKKSSTHGCAYAATKAGLSHFGTSLFDEIRKTGAKVITIHPDMTRTRFYDHLDFKEGDEEGTYLTAQCVADAVAHVLSQREGTVITELTIRPQKNAIVRKKPQTP